MNWGIVGAVGGILSLAFTLIMTAFRGSRSSATDKAMLYNHDEELKRMRGVFASSADFASRQDELNKQFRRDIERFGK